MLTQIVKDTGERRNAAIVGLWRCDCGNVKKIQNRKANKETKSCGCLIRENARMLNNKGGISKHPYYNSWKNMFRRCYNENDTHFKWYGGRGITVCDEWKDFKVFTKWVDNYSTGLSIERIDIEKGYSPSNCTMIKMSDQYKNKSNTNYVMFNRKKVRIATLAKVVGAYPQSLKRSISSKGINKAIQYYLNKGGN